ncbi:hypothetical protein [Bradyrhizobium sp. URHD0069]|uniref:hypothetical protein n=1 Tax=Bradyrhizobium sp. URHD0069 TaxID=1380355 RepID=UPI0012DDD2E4|nr:hypothetical protein [Bradyrhizobium sp. URHD0069]
MTAMRQAIIEACDLLAERKYGSPARSPAHNARLVLEAALQQHTISAEKDRSAALLDAISAILIIPTSISLYLNKAEAEAATETKKRAIEAIRRLYDAEAIR